MAASASDPIPIPTHSKPNEPNVSLEAALEELELKYTSPPTDLVPGICFLSCSPPKGECIRRLRTVVLSGSGIGALGTPSGVRGALRSVRELDLSRNQLRDWRQVGALLTALPDLKSLDLGFNPLRGAGPDPSSFLTTAHQLEVLALNGVHVGRDALGTLLRFLPKLRVLQLCAVPLPTEAGASRASDEKENEDAGWLGAAPHALQELYVEECGVERFGAVAALGAQFPRLRTLGLANNRIRRVPAACERTHKRIGELLPELRTLCLNGCPLAGWDSIEALAELPRLQELRLREAPLLDDLDCDLRHHMLIPRIPQLKVLNGSEITPRYREDCERAFIRFYQNRSPKPPIYQKLVDVHGHLEQLVIVDLTPQETVRTRLRCDEKNINTLIRHRLHITVRAFMRALCKPTGIPMGRLRVLHITPQYPARSPAELRPSNQFLHTLRVEDGDEFHVFTKIVPPSVSHL